MSAPRLCGGTRRVRSIVVSGHMLLAVVAAGCGSLREREVAHEEVVRGRAPVSWPPSSSEALRALIAHAALELTHPSCEGVTGDPEDRDLGDALTHLLAQKASAEVEEIPSAFRISCRPEGAVKARCRLVVRVEGDDPWEYGLDFELDRDGGIDPRTIECPGVG
jgi:hypothetical protein